MSKIGRRPIDIQGVEVSVSGQDIHYKGKNNSGVYVLSPGLEAHVEDSKLFIKPTTKNRDMNMVWGMSRALMANAISGAKAPFERIVEIKGLGFKATRVGDNLEFSLGYSHKITCDIPENVTIEIDKTGQKLTLKSFDKEALGAFCDRIKSFRRPEPYKGTGIKLSTETIARKAGKAKSA